VRELLTWKGEVCGGPAGGLLEPAGPPALAPTPRFDLAAADSLLDASGWFERDAQGYRTRSGSRLRIEMHYDRANQFREQTATLLEADLARAGIELAVVPADGASVWTRLRSDLFVTMLVGFRPPVFPDPSALWSSAGHWNGTGFASLQVDSLCAALGSEEDAVRLGLLARTIESHIRGSGPATFLVYREWAALLGPRVRDFAGTAGDPLRGLERVRLDEPAGRGDSAGRAGTAEREAPVSRPRFRDSGR
jgi:ABC-type transport system substrate-binding protein